MRSLFIVAALFLTALSVRAADAPIVSVWPQWRNAESFDRIGEYFGRGENSGGHHILRTHADTRAGFYFQVKLAPTAVPADAKFEVQVIAPDNPEPKTFSFPATSSSSTRDNLVELGLTGADWPGGEKARPVAWRVALVAADGRVLAEQKSFLWENPAK